MNTIEEIREFANQNPVTWVATAVADQPHLRAMAMWFADLQIRKGTRKGGILKPNGGPVYTRINIAQQIAERRAKRLAKGLQPGQDR